MTDDPEPLDELIARIIARAHRCTLDEALTKWRERQEP